MTDMSAAGTRLWPPAFYRMRHVLVTTGLALALAVPVPAAASASAMFCFGNPFFCRDDEAFQERNSTLFDLGIEVNDVPLTRPAVGRFLATLEPQSQYIIRNTCRNYLTRPGQVRSPRTLYFCQVALSL
jgi:hypothetical protein